MQRIDEHIVLYFQSIRCEQLTKLFTLFVPLEFWNVLAVVLILLCFLRTKVLRVPLISFVFVKILSTYSYDTLKELFHRPRPYLAVKGLVPVMQVHGFSFPSGHATLAMAMTVVLSHHFPKARYLILLVALLVGASRIYFGVHYLSDVLAGYVLGIILGFLCLTIERTIIAATSGIDLGTKQGAAK